ncbi:hypothetical protein PLICRDRAFT_46607 [Plicaturopsis crispa FD-325 SS-3]|uniref:Uncharacterized protein n=1 Tax=Plicaturopsis crispa FD-325 SS-3 TaxID=944288 RepID=A0A0C9T4M4_PLICR|nr:hypothetical protein PLICRDRAFT_46607 [Plicaturopsis crispa FD-325 SS-3]
MQHGAGTFVSTITAIRDQETLKRILRACDAARKLGLKDPQGFIDPAARDPIQFIDIHLSSGFANEMHEIVRRRWVGLGGG